MIPSYILPNDSYRGAAYARPQAAFLELYEYLGHEKFVKSLKNFINQWKGKHPIPYDLFNSFNNSCGENLDWFWKPWFYELGYSDIGIKTVTQNTITLENLGNMPLGINLELHFSDNTSEKLKFSCSIWKGQKSIVQIPFNMDGKVLKKALLSWSNDRDANSKNDSWVLHK